MSLEHNQAVYSTVAFRSWSHRTRLIPEEKFLIEKYLDRNLKTVEAGTAGGRILFEMSALGFRSLFGFDYVPGFIEAARGKDRLSRIQFDVQDAVSLTYDDGSFDQIIYLQQILSMMESEPARLSALREAFRILKPGGTALLSFLSFEARSQSRIYAPYLMYLRLLRGLRGSTQRIQYQPWLKLGGKLNWAALVDQQPYVYWYRLQEIAEFLRATGFVLVGVGSSHQIERAALCESFQDFARQTIDGMVYVVAKKPA